MTPAKRVALVVGQLQTGGAERQLHELAIRIDRARYEPIVVCLSEVGEPYASRLGGHQIRVILLQRSRHYDPARVFKLSHLLRAEQIDLVHSFLIGANAYAWSASILTRAVRRVPVIASSRTCIPPGNALLRMIHRRVFHGAAAVIANSEKVRQFTEDLYGLPSGSVRVIPNGIDLARFVAREAGARDAVRAELGIPAGSRVAGTIGRVSPEKNLGLFLAMARNLCAGAASDTRFVIVGDGPALEALRHQAVAQGLADKVHFTGARQDVERLLSAFDLFVLTSDTEGLPNAVMEAMAARLPVVATRAGGTVELVTDGVTGRLVDTGDLDRLVSSTRDLLSDEQACRRMGDAGRRSIETSYSVDRMVGSTLALYDEILS